LLGVLGLAPAGAVRGDVGVATGVECHRLGVDKRGGGSLGLPLFDWVQARQQLLAAFTGRRTSRGERHGVERTYSELPVLAGAAVCVAEQPIAAEHTVFARRHP
jgi:hypothetical protein